MPAIEVVRKLKTLTLFSDLPETVLKNLAESCSFFTIEDGGKLFASGDSAEFCYVVSFGAVRLARALPGGKEVVMCFCRPGDFIAAAIMANPTPHYPVTATTTELTGLIKIPRRHFLEVWQAEPAVAKKVNLHMMNRLMEFQSDKTMSVSSVPQRIASFLLRTLETQPVEFGSRLNLKLARRDIAERVGTSVETVIRILSQWTQSGWVATEEQRIDILNRRALQEIVDRG